MLLLELFDDSENDDDQSVPSHGEMRQQLRQAALDIITPMLGQNVPFVTMKQIVDSMSGARFGIVITPALIMDILNPDEVKAVSKIEGDRIYLQDPSSTDREVNKDQAEQDAEKVSDMAVNQINQEIKQ